MTDKTMGREEAVIKLTEVSCDLHYLMGRASKEGHEAGQRLATQVRAKMGKAITAPTEAEVEAAAETMFLVQWGEEANRGWRELGNGTRETYLRMARAALAASRGAGGGE
jgi:hypothetical protein